MQSDREKWNVHFRWTITSVDSESVYRRVRCGYAESEEDAEYGILPPSMCMIRVGVYDSSRDKLCGWALEHTMDTKGGVSFTISLNNYSQEDAVVAYYLANLEKLPERFDAKILDKGNNGYVECSAENNATLTIAADNSEMRILAVGTDEYLHHVLAGLLPMKLLKAYPNPFHTGIMIQYRLPFGIREIRFTLYNLQGKTLWEGVDRTYVTPGEHLFRFTGKTTGGALLPAGVYILRMTAKNASGKAVYGGLKRLTCIK